MYGLLHRLLLLGLWVWLSLSGDLHAAFEKLGEAIAEAVMRWVLVVLAVVVLGVVLGSAVVVAVVQGTRRAPPASD